VAPDEAPDETPDETPDEVPVEPDLAAAEPEAEGLLEPEASRVPGMISAVGEETAGMRPDPLAEDDGNPSEEAER
jgi:hypothetical protein